MIKTPNVSHVIPHPNMNSWGCPAGLVQSLIKEDWSVQMWTLLLGKNIDYNTWTHHYSSYHSYNYWHLLPFQQSPEKLTNTVGVTRFSCVYQSLGCSRCYHGVLSEDALMPRACFHIVPKSLWAKGMLCCSEPWIF